MPLYVVVGFGWNVLLVSFLTYGNPARGNLWWCFLFPWCVVSIGMSRYWQVSIQVRMLLHRVILISLSQSMPCASSQVCWNYLWIPICVTPVPFLGWSCIWSLLMLGTTGGSTWFSHATLKGFSVAMLGYCCCSPQWYIHRCLILALLMVLQRLCCWLFPPWWWHFGGVSYIVGDLVDAIVGAVAVPIFFISSVIGIAGLRNIVLAVWHVLRDLSSQSTIPVYLANMNF